MQYAKIDHRVSVALLAPLPACLCAGALTTLLGYGPAISEHVILEAGLVPSLLLRPGSKPEHAAGSKAWAGKEGGKQGSKAGKGGAGKEAE